MKFSTSIVAAIMAFTASAAPLEARQDDGIFFEVDFTSSQSPSGRPGEQRFAYIRANVTDPNTHVLGQADGQDVTKAPFKGLNCEASYIIGEDPFNHSWHCDSDRSGEGYFTMKVLPGSDGGVGWSSYGLEFTHVADVLVRTTGGGQFKKTYRGSGQFKVGDNLSGTCGGSGFCSSGLKSELRPFKIAAQEVTSSS